MALSRVMFKKYSKDGRVTIVQIDKEVLDLLSPLVALARAELLDWEPDDVPISARKAVMSSARSLPPPLARSLVEAVGANDKLRDGVLERLERTDSPSEELISFLKDPRASIDMLSDLADARRAAQAATVLAEAEGRIRSLTSQISEAKRRAQELREANELAVADARVAGGEDVGRLRARANRLEGTVESLRQELERNSATIEDLRLSLADERARSERLGDQARRRSVAADHEPRTPGADLTPSDPIELARLLDAMERHMHPHRSPDSSEGEGSSEPTLGSSLAVPHGLSPRSSAALDALIRQRPRRVIIDGYNVAGVMRPDDFSSRNARDDVVALAGKLARVSATEVVVVFDGVDVDGRSSFRSDAGVLIEFSRGVKADDVIADDVSSGPGGVVVITNDRDLRERCSVGGCVPLWANALVTWSQS